MHNNRTLYTVTGHARFSRHASRDENNLCSGEGFLQPIITITRLVSGNSASRIDVANVSRNTYDPPQSA